MNLPIGFIVLDKPAGITSHDCVNRIRKIFGIKRVGHGGTLDPAVTGVLPIAVGHATRLLRYLPGDKKYIATIQLGKSTETDDLEGQILEIKSVPQITEAHLKQHLTNFQGQVQQRPPYFSSIHIQGKRSYELARKGELIDLPERMVTIFECRLLRWDPIINELEICVHCSAGTYIRSIARDLGEMMRCGGCLKRLRRIEALGFHENQAVPLPVKVNDNVHTESAFLLPIKSALSHLPRIELNEQEQNHWRTGKTIHFNISQLQSAPNPYLIGNNIFKNVVAVMDTLGEIEGIGNIDGLTTIKPKVVLNAKG